MHLSGKNRPASGNGQGGAQWELVPAGDSVSIAGPDRVKVARQESLTDT